MEPREQEKALGSLLARALRQNPLAVTSVCPEPEILAAYSDRSLAEAEAAHWEAHFARCTRCQEILVSLTAAEAEPLPSLQAAAEMAVERIGGEPVAESAPAPSAAEQPKPVEAPREIFAPTPPRRRALTWRWLAPALAAAAALAVWVAMRPKPPVIQPKQPASESEVARATPAPQPPAVQAPGKASGAAGAPATPAEEPGSLGKLRGEAAPPMKAEEKRDALARKESAEITAEKAKQVEAMKPSEAEVAKNAAPAPAPPAAGPRVVLPERRAARLDEKVEPQATESTEAKTEFAVKPQVATRAAPSAAAGREAQAEARAAQAAAGIESQLRESMKLAGAVKPGFVIVASPNPMIFWRIGPAGSIERSTDGGATWQPQSSRITADLLAGSAPSETVCWAAGRGGAILRTTDGETWRKVFSPGAFDWVAIEARDARHATITSADKHSYVTDDGGQSWLIR